MTKWALQKLAAHFLKPVIRKSVTKFKRLWKRTKHLLAQSSLKQGLCIGGRKSPGSLSIPVLSSKDVSCSRDARACDKEDFCDPVARFQCWKSETSEELGLFRRNQATHEMLREEGSRYAPFLTRGSCEFSSFFGSPSFSPSSGKRKDKALARESFCLNEVVKEKEERIFSDSLEVIEPEIEEGGTPLSSEGFYDKILDKGFSPLRVSPLAVWASKGSKEKGFFPRERVSLGLEDVETTPLYERYSSSSLARQDSFLPLSVFGWVLLPGDSSGAGGSVDVDDRDDQLPWCVVHTNGKEWGMLSEGFLMEVEVESGSFGEWIRIENFLVDSEIGYESWEESCLVKFSEFLGFSTMGHEREILSFLWSLTVKQNQMSKG